jgi:hypothetical protein
VHLLGLIAGHDRITAEPDAAARIADLCDRLPLALRIAGNRLADRPDWPLSRLERQLSDPDRSLAALTAGDLDIRSALGSSYDRLFPTARKVFRGLGLLPGPVISIAAVAAATELAPEEAETELESLVDAQILRNATDGHYRVTPLPHLFARELLRTDDPPTVIPGPRRNDSPRPMVPLLARVDQLR